MEMWNSPRSGVAIRAMRSGALLALLALAAVPSVAQEGEGMDQGKIHRVLTFEDLFDRDRQPSAASRMDWSPQGDRLSYLWDDGEGAALWLQAPAAQPPTLAYRFADEGDFSGSPRRTTWLPDGSGFLLQFSSGLAILDLSDGETPPKLRPVKASTAEDEDPKLSPDGQRVSFVREADLWVLELGSGQARQLTEDGVEGEILNGKTDWVYWEELWGRNSTGHWWSPEGKRLAFYRFDDREVPTYPLVDFTQIPYPEVTPQRYPKAGETNPKVKVGVLSLDGGEVVWLQTDGPSEGYLARVHWLPDGKKVAVERLHREQNQLDLLLCDPGTGACEVLLTEANDTWVRVGDYTHFFQDGSFLWASQREGWNHLYLYNADGTLRYRVTPDGRNVTSLDRVNEEEGWLFYNGFPTGFTGASIRTFERVNLRGDRLRSPFGLTPAEGFHSGAASPDGKYWIHTFHNAHTPRRSVIRDLDSREVAAFPFEDPAPELRADLPKWEFISIPSPEGPDGPAGPELPARILKPPGFDPLRGEYPAIVYHYGCPESQVVQNAWSSRDLWHRWMASRGYVVFMVDNGQSNHFGKAGVDRAHRRFGTVNLQAQLAGVEYLKKTGWVDTRNLGLWGWSGGGANTLYVLTNSPGTFKAGVSGAPVTDWRLYDTIWTERYLDHPQDNPDGYRDSSPLTYADQLEDHLLIVHGTADDNVHPQNTLAFIHKLIDAGIPFEDAIYPRQKHGFRGDAMKHFYRRMTAFFDRHLMADEGPEEE